MFTFLSCRGGFKKCGGLTVNTGYSHIKGFIDFSRSTMMILSITGVVMQTKVLQNLRLMILFIKRFDIIMLKNVQ